MRSNWSKKDSLAQKTQTLQEFLVLSRFPMFSKVIRFRICFLQKQIYACVCVCVCVCVCQFVLKRTVVQV